ncbi:MAG: tyrosine-type recombinase/integrase, partial [Alphaproteobacteria bacterium]|nr:tyrosine-type recombinase/integrase [Alphaproteobacteria bacterium]
MDFDAVKRDFLDHCRGKGLSPHSLKAYRQDLADYAGWLAREGTAEPLTRDAIAGWVLALQDRALAPASIKRRVACLKVLCRWLEEEGRIETSPFHRLRFDIRLPRRLPRNVRRDDLRTLFAAAIRPPAHAASRMARETLHLAIELMFTTGVRVGELCAIRVDDIDLGEGVIRIRGKGNRERRVFFVDDAVRAHVRSYLKRRAATRPATERLLVTR